MSDLISRQAAVELCMKYNGVGWVWSQILDEIKEMPSADVQPVRHGHWIIKDNPGTGWYRVTCSECGEDVTSVAPVIGFFPNARVTWDFCYNCGAKMDKER